jgi:hypothetical protein
MWKWAKIRHGGSRQAWLARGIRRIDTREAVDVCRQIDLVEVADGHWVTRGELLTFIVLCLAMP